MTITCKSHPGGPADLPETDFYLSDRDRAFALCKRCRLRQAKERGIAKKNGTYTPKPHRYAPRMPASSNGELPSITVSELTSPARFVKIGDYFISESAVLIADTLQDGKVVLFTTILEIDGDTKHPRNKRLIFTRQNAPDEYHATIAWLNSVAGIPSATEQTINEQAAMALAEEATKELAKANAKISELEAALAPLRTLLGKV